MKLILVLSLLVGISWGTWLIGQHFIWDWGSFWSNLISNAASSAIIGFFLYLAITRPDEQKANKKRRDQALSMLKIEFSINRERAKLYAEALKNPQSGFSALYPLRFTRGAWNALKESGFLPQLDDVAFVYELLRVNEIIIVADSSLSTVRRSKADNKKTKLNTYARKAVKECAQLESYFAPILEKLEAMNLPEVKLREIETDVSNDDDDDVDEGDSSS